MFFTTPPAKEIKFDFPADKLGAIWISITDIQPEGGAVNVYSNPLDRPPVRLDAAHAEQRIVTTEPVIYVQPMMGTNSYKLKVTGAVERMRTSCNE